MRWGGKLILTLIIDGELILAEGGKISKLSQAFKRGNFNF
jgi:hypothetical protein